MNSRSKILMIVTLGAASAMAFVGAGCELLVTFPASEIGEGGLDGFTTETSTDAPGSDVTSDSPKPGDAAKEVGQPDTGTDAPEDSPTTDAPEDAPVDAPTDAPHDGGTDALTDAPTDAPDAG
jgi:hypothetical protein